MAETVKTSIIFSKVAMDFLKQEAKRLGIRVPDLVRRIVDAYREK